jgi:hypothetical protein
MVYCYKESGPSLSPSRRPQRATVDLQASEVCDLGGLGCRSAAEPHPFRTRRMARPDAGPGTSARAIAAHSMPCAGVILGVWFKILRRHAPAACMLALVLSHCLTDSPVPEDWQSFGRTASPALLTARCARFVCFVVPQEA